MARVRIPRALCDGRRLPAVCVFSGADAGIEYRRVILEELTASGWSGVAMVAGQATGLPLPDGLEQVQVAIDLPVHPAAAARVEREGRLRAAAVAIGGAICIGAVVLLVREETMSGLGAGALGAAIVTFGLHRTRVRILRADEHAIDLDIPSAAAAEAFRSAVLSDVRS